MTAKVGICIPAQDQVQTWFCYDLARFTGWTAASRPDIEQKLYIATGSLLPQQRERLVVQALTDQCTHVLMLDSDMQFPKDVLARMLMHSEPVVAANYTARRPPFLPVARRAITNDPTARVFTMESSSGLEAVAAVGLGVMLVQAETIRKIPRPRFMVGYVPDDNDYVGEDFYFCKQLQDVGAPILIDHDLSKDVSHIGTFAYAQEHAIVAGREARVLPPEDDYEPDADNAALQGDDVPPDPLTDA